MHQPARRRRRGPRRNHCSYPGCSPRSARSLAWGCRPPLRRSGRACWLDRPARAGPRGPAGPRVRPAGMRPERSCRPRRAPAPGFAVVLRRSAARTRRPTRVRGVTGLPVTAVSGARPDSGRRHRAPGAERRGDRGHRALATGCGRRRARRPAPAGRGLRSRPRVPRTGRVRAGPAAGKPAAVPIWHGGRTATPSRAPASSQTSAGIASRRGAWPGAAGPARATPDRPPAGGREAGRRAGPSSLSTMPMDAWVLLGRTTMRGLPTRGDGKPSSRAQGVTLTSQGVLTAHKTRICRTRRQCHLCLMQRLDRV